MKIFNKVSIITLAVLFAFILTGSALAAGPAGVNLGSAGNFTVLAKTGISTTGPTAVVGDIGISPAAASYLTGFALTLPAGNAFSTSALVTGKVYAPGYADPTPANMTAAVSNMEAAYTDAMGRTNPTATELGAGNIGGMTLAPGLYKWSTGVTIPTDVTLSGGANDVWIFQVAQNLDISSATKVVLSGGAQASNIFWVVAGQTTLGTTSIFNGNILDQTAIVLNTGAKLNGRALAQTAVTLDSNSVSAPVAVVITPTSTPSLTPAVVLPLISITKIPTLLSSLSTGGGVVQFDYAVSNSGTVAMNNVIVADNKCSPVSFISGDTNNDLKLDINETWHYRCTANISQTTTNIVTATGQANGFTATTTANATVVVNAPTPVTPTPTVTIVPATLAPTVTIAPIATPKLPKTGYPSEEKSAPWNIILPAGIFVALLSFYLVQNKRVI